MTDINDIKNIIYFLSYLRVETWYVIGSCIGIYVIHIFFLALAERHRKYRERISRIESGASPHETALQEISLLDGDGHEFFVRLNFIIRRYLELSEYVPGAIKKTSDEILRILPSDGLRTLLETCSMHEYAPVDHTDLPTREAMRTLAREIVEELHEKTI